MQFTENLDDDDPAEQSAEYGCEEDDAIDVSDL